MRILMVNCADPRAPYLDKSDPTSLAQYLYHLDKEFARMGITSNAEKKEWSIYYLEIDTATIWEAMPEYKKEDVPYKAYIRTIIHLYLESLAEEQYQRKGSDTYQKPSTEGLVIHLWWRDCQMHSPRKNNHSTAGDAMCVWGPTARARTYEHR